jgi:hypothetical protein
VLSLDHLAADIDFLYKLPGLIGVPSLPDVGSSIKEEIRLYHQDLQF